MVVQYWFYLLHFVQKWPALGCMVHDCAIPAVDPVNNRCVVAAKTAILFYRISFGLLLVFFDTCSEIQQAVSKHSRTSPEQKVDLLLSLA
jgi:hypothetical protein